MADDDIAQISKPVSKPAVALRADILEWCEAWRSCFQGVLTQVAGAGSGQGAVFEISPERFPSTPTDLYYTVTAGGAAQGEMVLRLPVASAKRFATKFLGEPEPAAPADGSPDAVAESVSTEHKEALEELLRQISGLAATALASMAGGQVKLSLETGSAPAWTAEADVSLRTRDEAGREIAIGIQISPTLAGALLLKPNPEVTPAPPPAVQPSAARAAAPAIPPPSAAEVSNYNRLMDVGLDVKLRFGTRRMQLRDVLALSAGIVIELDNALHSPVDLLLDGRLIAQGEVVVVDGKYGLRVTEVVNPQPNA